MLKHTIIEIILLMYEFKNTIIGIIFYALSIFFLGISICGLLIYFEYISPIKMFIGGFLIAVILYCFGWLFDDKAKKELEDIE